GSISPVQLLASGARTTSGAGQLTAVQAEYSWICFELLVTAASGGGGATLDIYVQQCLDGVNYDDVVHFPQILGTSTGEAYVASMSVRVQGAANEMHQMQDMGLAAGTVQHTVLGRQFRARYQVAGGGSFTFQVLAFPRTGR